MAAGTTKAQSACAAGTKKRKTSASVTLTVKEPIVSNPVAAPAKSAKVATPSKAVTAKMMMKKGELIDQVVERTGVKKRDAKASVEAALVVLSAALTNETDLNLPPLGKIRIVKSKDINDGAQILTLKLRTMKTKAPETDAEGR